MKSRHWSIRSKIIALVMVPLTALLVLWIFATTLTAGPAFNLLSAQQLLTNVGNPGEVLVSELQRERRMTVEFLSGTGPVPGRLDAQRTETDRAAADFRRTAAGDDARGAASDELNDRIAQVLSELDGLPDQRAHVNDRTMDPIGAQRLYGSMINAGFEMFEAFGALGDENIDREIRAITDIGYGREYLSRVDSLLAGATVAGEFSEPVRTQLIQDIGIARFLLEAGVDDLPEDRRAAYRVLSRGVYLTSLNRMMDSLIDRSRTGVVSPVAGDTWHAMYVTAAEELRTFELDSANALADRTTPLAVRILAQLGLAGILGLVAVIVSIVVSIKVGRSIVGRLRRLRGEALEMATERLPNVVRRLQRGEVVDVDVETPPLRYGKDEIGELGNAFNDVQRTAVQSAVEEATVRRGLNEVFLNIARRSQTLLHRQLALLDKMERRETEPQELEDLYRVDHLATRMRRHAEDLVILAGAAPGRGWRNPVPVIDVVRGAISEVEDYKRVDIRSVESASLLGRAVGDVIHLLAELLENAASFSPPHTRVQVSGQVLPNGYALEIEDRGLGMTQEAIDEANRRLVEPPDFDPTDSARLGLFVVAQLANRHGIRVSLRASAYAGVTAIVLIPGELVTAGTGPAALPAGPSSPERMRERPLVGSGNDDPSRRSLAALQWQGTEELRQVTVAGRPVTINGTATPIPQQHSTPSPGPAPAPLEWAPDPTAGLRPPLGLGGPAPSSVADGLSAEGLVQRRRRRPVDLGTSVPPQIDPAGVAPRTAEPPTAPTSATPLFAAPVSPAAGDALPSIEDGLPRRVRQANLVPQLRRQAGAPPPDDEVTAPLRSPEQMRSIMSALQQGTTRGRIDAARYVEDPASPAEDTTPTNGRHGNSAALPGVNADSEPEDRSNPEDLGDHGRSGGTSFADAATVSFPAIVNATLARDETSPGAGTNAAGDRADDPERNDVTRPEKDA